MDIETLQNTINSNDAVMIYFSGENCGICKVLMPKVKNLFDNKFTKVKQIYISADEYTQTSAQFNVLTIPTVIVFFDKKEFVRQSRHISIQDLEAQIQRPYNIFFK